VNIKFRDRKRFFIFTLRNSEKSGFENGVPGKIDLDEKLDVLFLGKQLITLVSET
jgi:hypothetical protein